VCGGSGHVRSVSSVALQLMRAVEEMLIKSATHNLIVRTRAEVALYVLNHKRAHLRVLEERFRITITVSADPTVTGQQSYVIDRGEQVHTPEAARNLAAQQPQIPVSADEAEEDFVAGDEQEDSTELAAAEPEGVAPREGGERENGRKRRRRRGRGGRGRGGEPRRDTQAFTHDTVPEHAIAHEDHDGGLPEENGSGQQPSTEDGAQIGEGETREGGRRRRRGRRGGRRNRQRNGERPPFQGDATPESEARRPDEQPQYESEPVYAVPVEHHPAPPPEEPAVAASDQDVRRRRSTIREPVAFSGEGMPPSPANLPPPTPVVSSSGADEQTAPKRGWWGKRLLGDKS